MFSRSPKFGNVLLATELQGFRKGRASARNNLKLMPNPSGNAHQRLTDASSRKSCFGGTKGQLEGSAVTGKTGKPWVAGTDRKTWNAAGQNNSSPTPYAASVANGGWELILVNSSHYCFYMVPLLSFLLQSCC
ncbi:MAG: hypothetical protein MUO72_06940 [Bacteroidales bacterium]|nr:hypothetical protein [Bacteroidales bacterium]